MADCTESQHHAIDFYVPPSIERPDGSLVVHVVQPRRGGEDLNDLARVLRLDILRPES